MRSIPEDTIYTNCYKYLLSIYGELPRSKDLIPNVDRPIVNAIAVFDYDGLPHFGRAAEILETSTTTFLLIDECNFVAGVCAKRWIDINYEKLVGFHLLDT